MRGFQVDIAGLIAIAMAQQAILAGTLHASPTYPYRSRRPGDRAHKRWKRARRGGRN